MENRVKPLWRDGPLLIPDSVNARYWFKQAASYRIPQDIAVVGFDNMPLCTYIELALTTIHVPKQYMGRMAVHRLHEVICAPDSQPIKIEISTKIVKRKSC